MYVLWYSVSWVGDIFSYIRPDPSRDAVCGEGRMASAAGTWWIDVYQSMATAESSSSFVWWSTSVRDGVADGTAAEQWVPTNKQLTYLATAPSLSKRPRFTFWTRQCALHTHKTTLCMMSQLQPNSTRVTDTSAICWDEGRFRRLPIQHDWEDISADSSYSNTTVYYGIHERNECILVDSGVTNLIHDHRSCVDFTLEVEVNVVQYVHSSVNKPSVKRNSGLWDVYPLQTLLWR